MYSTNVILQNKLSIRLMLPFDNLFSIVSISIVWLNIQQIWLLSFRYSSSAVQNATKTSRRRRIPVRQNGPKPSEKVLEKNWQWIHHLSSKNVETHLSNTTENYGNRQVRYISCFFCSTPMICSLDGFTNFVFTNPDFFYQICWFFWSSQNWFLIRETISWADQ